MNQDRGIRRSERKVMRRIESMELLEILIKVSVQIGSTSVLELHG